MGIFPEICCNFFRKFLEIFNSYIDLTNNNAISLFFTGIYRLMIVFSLFYVLANSNCSLRLTSLCMIDVYIKFSFY